MSLEDPTDLAGQRRAQEQEAKTGDLIRQQDADDFKALMATKRGRRFVWRLLEMAGVYRSSFGTNALQMAFTEGNRNTGLFLMAQIHEHCPEAYLTMLREQRTK